MGRQEEKDRQAYNDWQARCQTRVTKQGRVNTVQTSGMESHPRLSSQTKQVTDSDISQQNVCKYYNVGFCKCRDKCRFQHNKAECQNNSWRSKCIKRNKKLCKYGTNCTHQENCEFKQSNKTLTSNIDFKSDIENLKSLVKDLSDERKKFKLE